MKKVSRVKNYEEECSFDDPTLCAVMTVREASLMWGKSETAIFHAIYRKHISGRKSFTGGDWIISRHSMIAHYGEPKEDIVCALLK